jgi:hypothetical protein
MIKTCLQLIFDVTDCLFNYSKVTTMGRVGNYGRITIQTSRTTQNKKRLKKNSPTAGKIVMVRDYHVIKLKCQE